MLLTEREVMNNQIQALLDSVEQVIVGKRPVITRVVAALLCNGHVLIEDVPGVGKTQLAASLSRSLGGSFNRIQLTPDIMPSDVVGFSMVDQQTGKLEYRPGAAMCNFLLADEINRASPKVQSSLLEVMEEYQISLDGQTRPLPRPFMVLATQNPVETYGTYHLPEAQMDRFFMRISMGYPTPEEEMRILERTEHYNPIGNIKAPAVTLDSVLRLQQQVAQVTVADSVKAYILSIVSATRSMEEVTLGVSPRGSIALYKAAKANAFMFERSYVTPGDVKAMAECVLAHRILLSAKGKTVFGTPQACLASVLDRVAVPMG